MKREYRLTRHYDKITIKYLICLYFRVMLSTTSNGRAVPAGTLTLSIFNTGAGGERGGGDTGWAPGGV